MLTEGTEGKLPSCARREPCRDPKKREKRQRTRQRTQRTTMGGEAQGCDWWNQDLGPSNTWIWWWVDDLIFSMGNPIRLRLGNRLQMEQTAAVGNGPYSNNHGEVQRGGRLKRAGIISISQDTVVYLESQQVKQSPSFDVGEILVFPPMFNFFRYSSTDTPPFADDWLYFAIHSDLSFPLEAQRWTNNGYHRITWNPPRRRKLRPPRIAKFRK